MNINLNVFIVLITVVLFDVPDVYGQGHPNETKDNYTMSEIAKIIKQADDMVIYLVN